MLNDTSAFNIAIIIVYIVEKSCISFNSKISEMSNILVYLGRYFFLRYLATLSNLYYYYDFRKTSRVKTISQII